MPFNYTQGTSADLWWFCCAQCENFLAGWFLRSLLTFKILFANELFFKFVTQLYCCCCSVAKSCMTLFVPMDCNTPGFPVLHYLLKFAQTHVHWVSDAIQPSHPLLSPSPPALNLSWHQVLFQWCLFVSGDRSIGVSASAPVLPIKFRVVPLGLTDLISLQPKRFSRVISSTTIQKH